MKVQAKQADGPALADLRATEEFLYPGGASDASRREFLRLAGFGVLGASLAACSRGPERQVVPMLLGSEGLVAGRAYWIATTCAGCAAGCGVVAKCRDGRPLKLEGNALHRLSKGGLCAIGQAQILSLYDSKRSASPLVDGVAVSWEAAEQQLRERLAAARTRGGRVRLLTGTMHSPSTRALVQRFCEAEGDGAHTSYDALSVSAILDAHLATHGRRALPAYRFSAARAIVSFEADFLGTWISPVQYAADYAAGRRPDGEGGQMSRHEQFEGRLSLTGAAADLRTRTAPWELPAVLSALCEALDRRAGIESRFAGALASSRLAAPIERAAESLFANRGASLVVCGVNDLQLQTLTNYANALLGNYGETLSLARESLQRDGSDGRLETLKSELLAGEVDVLLLSGVNPCYDLPSDFGEALALAGTLVVHSDGLDETSRAADILLPAAHALESWDDAELELGRFSFSQPTVPALRQGRSLRQVLARALGDEREDGELLRSFWRERLLDGGLEGVDLSGGADAAFDRLLHDGYVEAALPATEEPGLRSDAVTAVELPAEPEGLALVLYPKVSMLDGRHAHNPWLQELPDPLTKVCWDNYAIVSERLAGEQGLEVGEVVRVSSADGTASVELPLVVQRGQHDRVVAIALGYGRLGTDRFERLAPDWLEGEPTIRAGETLGVNLAPWLRFEAGLSRGDGQRVQLARTGRRVELACTQDHHSLELPAHLAPAGAEVRDAIVTLDFETYAADPTRAMPHAHESKADLWPRDHEAKGFHWGVSVDLTACTGCSACAVACMAENNVPVVGRDEVRRHREMSWLRIDRYMAGEGDEVSAAWQPMFCQQCDNAPCESVCPVLATVHSSEGLNQQVYNRCVGTRYCANTCPYKVRRFNWFDYPREETLERHALNPDVTIRTRGVMEKCSFCAQRIQEAKSEAARSGVPLADGDIQVACQQSCPTQAIVFGDTNDPESAVSRRMARERAYGVLTELNVKPSVRYLARVRNTGEGGPETDARQETHHG